MIRLDRPDLDKVLEKIADTGRGLQGEFLAAPLNEDRDSDNDAQGQSSDEPGAVASLVALATWHGFLPMSAGRGEGLLLLKLHRQRCVLEPFSSAHIGRHTWKRAARFRLSVDQAFDDVVRATRQHTFTTRPGDNWLTPALAAQYAAVNRLPATARHGCTFHSVELWDLASGKLAAGEVGYTVGSIYSSCTGFALKREFPGAGTLQLTALGEWLHKSGFKVWDLGMEMDYKLAFGGRCRPRRAWVATVREHRNATPRLVSPGTNVSVRDLLAPARLASVTARLSAASTAAVGITAAAASSVPSISGGSAASGAVAIGIGGARGVDGCAAAASGSRTCQVGASVPRAEGLVDTWLVQVARERVQAACAAGALAGAQEAPRSGLQAGLRAYLRLSPLLSELLDIVALFGESRWPRPVAEVGQLLRRAAEAGTTGLSCHAGSDLLRRVALCFDAGVAAGLPSEISSGPDGVAALSSAVELAVSAELEAITEPAAHVAVAIRAQCATLDTLSMATLRWAIFPPTRALAALGRDHVLWRLLAPRLLVGASTTPPQTCPLSREVLCERLAFVAVACSLETSAAARVLHVHTLEHFGAYLSWELGDTRPGLRSRTSLEIASRRAAAGALPDATVVALASQICARLCDPEHLLAPPEGPAEVAALALMELSEQVISATCLPAYRLPCCFPATSLRIAKEGRHAREAKSNAFAEALSPARKRGPAADWLAGRTSGMRPEV